MLNLGSYCWVYGTVAVSATPMPVLPGFYSNSTRHSQSAQSRSVLLRMRSSLGQCWRGYKPKTNNAWGCARDVLHQSKVLGTVLLETLGILSVTRVGSLRHAPCSWPEYATEAPTGFGKASFRGRVGYRLPNTSNQDSAYALRSRSPCSAFSIERRMPYEFDRPSSFGRPRSERKRFHW